VKKLIALFWWIDRWRSSSAYVDLTLEEQGAYRNMLDEAQLRGGPIPNDERILGRACGDATAWPRVRAAVMRHFVLQSDGWRNETLDEVIAESMRRVNKQAAYRERKRNASGNEPGNASGNEPGNKAGNEPGNKAGNEPGNKAGNEPGNKAGSLSPSPDKDLSLTPRVREPKRVKRWLAYSGKRLEVSTETMDEMRKRIGDEI
jgi:uncharacterized protein YdaU (DUF1376 family)